MSDTQYAVDIVLCIDKTGSMSPVIDEVKRNALRLEGDLKAKMAEKQKIADKMRIRVIAFGDVYVDGASWIRQSEFFNLPEESDKFKVFVSGISPEGGGDEPENGLEALGFAIKSKWTSEGFKRRHVIVVWTDASAHSLETSKDKTISHYPTEIPRSFDDLTDLWNSQAISATSRRLVMFTPEAFPWNDIANHWEETVHFPSQAGNGLADMEYGSILDMLASSI